MATDNPGLKRWLVRVYSEFRTSDFSAGRTQIGSYVVWAADEYTAAEKAQHHVEGGIRCQVVGEMSDTADARMQDGVIQ